MNVYVNTSSMENNTSELPEMALANELLKKGQFQDAHVLYTQLFALKPNPDSLYGQAVCEFEMGRIDEALQTIEVLLDRFPEYSHGYNLAGVIAMSAGDPESAIAFFQVAQVKMPELVEAQRNEAEALFLTGHYIKGLQGLERILVDAPEDIPSMLRLAELYVEADQPALAKHYIKHVKQLDPENVRAGFLAQRCSLEHQPIRY